MRAALLLQVCPAACEEAWAMMDAALEISTIVLDSHLHYLFE
jgi:hypothetical protein